MSPRQANAKVAPSGDKAGAVAKRMASRAGNSETPIASVNHRHVATDANRMAALLKWGYLGISNRHVQCRGTETTIYILAGSYPAVQCAGTETPPHRKCRSRRGWEEVVDRTRYVPGPTYGSRLGTPVPLAVVRSSGVPAGNASG